MKTKLAFFDLDCTLSEPRYLKDDEYVIGFEDKKSWPEYCKLYKESTYDNCRIVPIVYNYAVLLKRSGAKLFVLSNSREYEYPGKTKFINDNYTGLFDEIILTLDPKHDVILEKAKEYGCKPEECELIEDSFDNILRAVEHNIKGTHLVNLINSLMIDFNLRLLNPDMEFNIKPKEE